MTRYAPLGKHTCRHCGAPIGWPPGDDSLWQDQTGSVFCNPEDIRRGARAQFHDADMSARRGTS